MGTTTLLSLDERLLGAIGDLKRHAVTTALGANTALISTHLQMYRSNADVFNTWWIYIEDQVNAGAERYVVDDDGTSTLSVLSALAANTTGTDETFRLSRSRWADRKLAINNAIRETYPATLRYLDYRTLVMGNILPNAHFEDWASSTQPDKYTAASGTTEANTTVAYIRGGAKSTKLTSNGTNDYFYLNSDDYPRLLDLMDKTVTAKVWVHPAGTADNATIIIYTKDKAGSTQTLASTTACGADVYTLLELEDQELNDDLVNVQIRFNVASSTGIVYFDDARVYATERREYLLPTDFALGTLQQVYVQTRGYSDDICDDLLSEYWEEVYGSNIIRDGADYYLQLPAFYSNNRRIRLIGDCPLEVLDASSDTISLSEEQPRNLLIKYAEYKLLQAKTSTPASEDVSRYKQAARDALNEYYRLLPSARMMRTGTRLNVRMY